MLRYMLDTNICIRAMTVDARSRLAGKFNRHAEQLCISAIVLAELRFRVENSKRAGHNQTELEHFLARLQAVLDFDAPAAAEFGRVRKALRNAPIGPFDTLIAAHARSRGLVLVTNNTKEFASVPGLEIEDWV